MEKKYICEINPENYRLFLYVDVKKCLGDGIVIIKIIINNPITNIKLNSLGLTIRNVWVNDKDVKYLLNKTGETLEIMNNFSVGINWIKISWNFVIGEDMSGLYWVKSNDHIIFSTQFEPTHARKVFPCFDNPKYKSTFDIIIITSKNKRVLGNMPIEKRIIKLENQVVKFYQTPLMSTYLVCFIIGDILESDSIKLNSLSNNLTVSGYYWANSSNKLKSSVRITGEAIRYFEKLFGISYQLPKLDIIPIPNFLSGAMENWGLITFRESGLMIDDINNIFNFLHGIEVIYHEISHQWFGNLVTLSSWKNIWLNEATATFFSWLGLEENYKHLNIKNWYYLLIYRSAMLVDGFESTHSINIGSDTLLDTFDMSDTLDNSEKISQYFDSISYSKGCCLLSYIYGLIGKTNFISGIKDYLQTFSYKTTKPDDLYVKIEKYAGDRLIITQMKSMIDIKGSPLITVKFDKLSGKYLITKNKLMLKPWKAIGSENYPIDIIIKVRNPSNKLLELKIKNEPVELHELSIINANNTLLCMVNYLNFFPDISLMNTEELMHLIDCTIYLSLSGIKNLGDIFELLSKIFDSIDFTKQLSKYICLIHLLIKNLIFINNIIIKSSSVNTRFSSQFTKLIGWIKPQIENIFIFIINKEKNKMEIYWILVDLIHFLIEFGDINIMKYCKKIFESIYQNELKKTIPNDFPLHEILFRIMIENDNNNKLDNLSNWDKIKLIYRKTDNVFVRNSALEAFGYTKSLNKLKEIIENIFEEVKLQDLAKFFNNLTKNNLNSFTELVIDWTFAVGKLDQRISKENFIHILEKICENIFDLQLINKLEKLIKLEVNDPDNNFENNSQILINILDKLEWNKNIQKNIKNY
jgi:hypothetical protein